MFDNAEASIHWNRCEEGLHIIGLNVFLLPQNDGCAVINKVLRFPDVIKGMPYQ